MAFLLIYIIFLVQGLPLTDGGQIGLTSDRSKRSDGLEFSIQDEYLVQNFTVEDGLPVNSINRVLQDDDGYLWFSSLDGLVRYDGYEFRVYNSGNTPGMYSNRIRDMMKTEENEIWLLHADGNLTRMAGSVFTPFENSAGTLKGNVTKIIQAKNGQIWIATNRGIALFNRETDMFEFVEAPLLQSNSLAIESAFGDEVLVVNESGLVRWNNKEATLLLDINDFPIPGSEVMQITQFRPDEIWVMGMEGMFRFALQELSIEYLYHNSNPSFSVWSLHPDSRQEGTFIINSSLGFYSFDPATEQLVKLDPELSPVMIRFHLVFLGPNGESIRIGDNEVLIDGQEVLRVEGILSAFLDREGSLWITTMRNGIFMLGKSNFSNITSDDISGFYNIYPVIQSADGAIWAGSFDSGIYRISGNEIDHWSAENSSLSSNTCRFLYEDSDGTIYASLWGTGLWMYKNSDWEKIEIVEELTRPDAVVEAMHRDNRNRLLIGTVGRVLIRQNGTYNYFDNTDSDAFQYVRVFRESSRGTLFLGTNGNGLTILSDEGFANYTIHNSGLTSNYIRDIYIQSPDTLWLVTQNLGLSRAILDEDSVPISFTSITEQDGLITNSLHRMIETPDRHLWISSNSGIMRVSRDELNRYANGGVDLLTVLEYNEQDGMSNREANGGVQTAGLLTSNQQLWFPNQDGVTIINPLPIALPLPEPVIEEVVFGDSRLLIDHRPELQIPVGERNLRIKFSAPNFSSPERIQFRYKLEGLNEDWEDGTQGREAVMTNVPPGTHQFQLAVNRTGNRSEIAEASVLITVPYFFYETIWFKLFLGLLGFLALLGGIKYRTRVLERRERKLQERVNRQTEELRKAAEQKSRFFSGITHELKTPLSLILSPLEDMLDGPEEATIRQSKNRLQLMHRNGQQLKNLVNQILDVTKLTADATRLTVKPVNITEITRQITGQFQSKLDVEKISLKFESDHIEESIYVDPGAWEQIVINLMSNAIRFSPENSSIQIRIKDHGDRVGIHVIDQGTGIEESKHQKVFEYLYQADGDQAAGGTGIGLYLVKGLVEHMGGKIDLISKKEEGAEFIVTLQKGYTHFRDIHTVAHEPFIKDISDGSRKSLNKPAPAQQNIAAWPNILVVEDNKDYRSYLESLISETYNVMTAPDGKLALDILNSNQADLIISDVMMPGMNGLEFIANLRKQEEYKHVPVVFLSAKDQEIDVEKGLSTGADIYLTKPIKSSLLMSQIAAVLRREKILKSNQVGKNAEEPELVKDIRELIYRQLGSSNLSTSVLADALYMSRTTLYREWKKESNVHLTDYIRHIRLDEAKTLLREKGFNVQETALAVGYSDAGNFSTSFKKEFGVRPSEVMK